MVIIALLMAVFVVVGVWSLFKVIQALEQPSVSALDKIIGSIGRVSQSIEATLPDAKPVGKVKVMGETWNATSAVPILVGTTVKVILVDTATKYLTVEVFTE